MFQDFIQFSLSGLTSGAIYALIALGFCVVNNTMGIVNFVQVDFVSLGAMLMFSALFTIVLSIILRGVIKLIWGTNRMALPPLTPDEPINILGATVLPQALWILLLTVIAITISEALGGLAGVLVTPITTLSYDVGVLLGLKGFAAAILGGFGSFPGAILGGLALGLLESLSAGYISSAYKDVVAFVVLLLVLFVRPKGLLGK